MAAPKKDQKIISKLTALLLQGPQTLATLVSRLEISERTVYRYIRYIDAELLEGRCIVRSGRVLYGTNCVVRSSRRPVKYRII